MADAAEKPKEKPKKKKTTGSTKEKEKKTTEKVTGTDPNKNEKQDEQTEQVKTTPQKTKGQQNTEETKLTDQPKANQPSKEIQKSNEPTVSGISDDPKPTTDKSQAEKAPAQKIMEPEFVPADISERPLVKPDYVPPPPATKRDVDLLKDMDEAKLEELREAFQLFDLDKDGVISSKDLRLTFATLGQPDIPDTEIKQMLSETIGPLDFESFVILLGYKTVEMDPETVLIDALSRWDYDNSGLISEERIKHDLVTWGDRFTPEEADLALDDAPVCMRKGVAMIDYIKFCNTLSGLRKKTKTPGPEDFMSHAH
ncbi:myosin regulatory light polypeptide 9-like isoform X1 [Schistocerca cancellata]|uniref:myosin regulatory light polypeptide 9-like isoform X1 n=1 Tax=Schistocerca cancellata TaxID=274614 RepID=UPI002118C096|nr:myosin regulatory light polypeptide 9-like isoform X1 [Schistocerca cancellata]